MKYERNGVANLFMMFAPLEGWRHVKATDHHAAVRAGAEGTVGLGLPAADKIVLVDIFLPPT